MKKISNKIKIRALLAICLWFIGSFLILKEGNGGGTISVIAVIIIAGFYRQIRKEKEMKIRHSMK